MGRKRGEKRKILPQLNPQMDWQEELARMLIAAGTDGLKQSDITIRFFKWIEADDILNELEYLAAAQKVQKFVIGGRGRPKTVWRATTEILKD